MLHLACGGCCASWLTVVVVGSGCHGRSPLSFHSFPGCHPFVSFLCSQVHPENDPEGKGLDQAKAYTVATGGHHAGVLHSSFVSEVKSDLMGEQTILCGMLQTGAVLSFDKMVSQGIDPGYASKLVQYGWETITEALKHGGITGERICWRCVGGGDVWLTLVCFCFFSFCCCCCCDWTVQG